MSKYSVYVFCDECGETHPMGISIDLRDGPAEKASIGDAYKGKELPQNVANQKKLNRDYGFFPQEVIAAKIVLFIIYTKLRIIAILLLL
jgi:hypothetical protein